MSTGGGGDKAGSGGAPAAGAGGSVKTPTDFLKSIRGRPVVVKLNSGVDYRGMETEPSNNDDFLESSVFLDETHYKRGFEDGYKDGLVSGKEDGKEVGLKMGFQIGEEIGFYKGCIDVWNSLLQIDPAAFSDRVRKRIEQLGALLSNYPLLEPENEQVQHMMNEIRGTFKMISANLGVKLEYMGHPASFKQDFEDL